MEVGFYACEQVIIFNLLWIGFVFCVCEATNKTFQPSNQRTYFGSSSEIHLGGGTWMSICGGRGVMRGSDYVKLLMDLEGIVIKVSTFSLEQFGKGMFHTL